jgi:hypothetical protein
MMSKYKTGSIAESGAQGERWSTLAAQLDCGEEAQKT